MVEDPGPHVEDEAFADASREPALRQRQQRVDDGDRTDQRRERLHDAHPPGDDSVIDDRFEDERCGGAQCGVDDDQYEEAGQHPAVRACELHDPAQSARPQFLVRDRTVTLEGPCADGRPAVRNSHQSTLESMSLQLQHCKQASTTDHSRAVSPAARRPVSPAALPQLTCGAGHPVRHAPGPVGTARACAAATP